MEWDRCQSTAAISTSDLKASPSPQKSSLQSSPTGTAFKAPTTWDTEPGKQGMQLPGTHSIPHPALSCEQGGSGAGAEHGFAWVTTHLHHAVMHLVTNGDTQGEARCALGHDTSSKCHCSNYALSHEWLIGSSQKSPAPSNVSFWPAAETPNCSFPLQGTNTAHPSHSTCSQHWENTVHPRALDNYPTNFIQQSNYFHINNLKSDSNSKAAS